ncbi:dienelactone hydrolase family protein [Roseococcus sp. DSY-14]|uniref:dienelactone hydrolase family protein n=1 Tax=Roseococcus sp. DSY-14 TaxID=3369650 RepID=UPI00387AAB0C
MRRSLAPLLLLAGCAAVAADEAPPALALREVAIPGPGGVTLRALLALPERPTGAPVVALHGCGGIGTGARPLRPPPREVDWAARLVAAGHPVVMPDSFGSRGLGEACGVRGFPAGPFGLRRQDALAAADWARAQGWGAPVLLGWSHGGSTTLAAWAAAAPGQLAGAVAFYPGCVGAPAPRAEVGAPAPRGEVGAPAPRGEVGAPAPRGDTGAPAPLGQAAPPLLMLLGGEDDWTRPQPCQDWAARSPLVRAHLFPGARHGFDGLSGGVRQRLLPDGRTVSFGPDGPARAESRRMVMEFVAGLP